jgi:hypothetical protein
VSDNAAMASGLRFIILGDMEEDRGEEHRPPPRKSFGKFNPAVEVTSSFILWYLTELVLAEIQPRVTIQAEIPQEQGCFR